LTQGKSGFRLFGAWAIIRAMQTLRNARLIARLVLVWFALSLGAAIASPLVAPKASELVCSGASVKLIVQGADGEMAEMGHSALDCPLCAVMNAPPPVANMAVQPLMRCHTPCSRSRRRTSPRALAPPGRPARLPSSPELLYS
jgi:hypothetical protein